MPTRSKKTVAKRRQNHEPSGGTGTVRRPARVAPRSPVGFGSCGGRPILSALERNVCDRLTDLGVAHSHRPRHFEIRLVDESLAAYAPTIVVRGRGREGKTVVIEACEAAEAGPLAKIRAFRKQYGLEFYVCMVAPEEALDAVHFDTYDEACSTVEIHTLVSRLAD